MDAYEPFASLGLALAAGLLIGLEREQSAPEPTEKSGGSFLGGVRTHPLFSLLGALSVLLSRQFGVWPVLFGGVATVGFLVVSYADDVKRGNDRGLTSEAAFLLSFWLGALSLTEGILPQREKIFVVASLSVVVTLLLSGKDWLHTFVQKTSKEDVFATLKFLIVAVVVLPLLPNESFGPLLVLNPFKIGMMVVLIAGISFVGYLSIRLLGARRGIGLTGLVGGLVSSTAVTLSFSDRAKKEPSLLLSCALAVLLASSIMFGRVLAEVAVVNQALLQTLLVPMGMMGAGGVLASLWVAWKAKKESKGEAENVKLENPFELSSALKFALLFAGVLLVSKAATTYFGTGATYLAGLLAGLTDVDAITLSMANLAKDQLSPQVASTTIVLAVLSNTLVKGSLAISIGGWSFGRYIATGYAVALAFGGVGLGVVWLS
jgi:uncharacterized membrane protein (DUF4010 family)